MCLRRKKLLSLILGVGIFGVGIAQASPLVPSDSAVPVVVDADHSITCEEQKNTCTAVGNAKAIKGDLSVFGDTLIAHFVEGDDGREMVALEAKGNVKIHQLDQKAIGDYAHYDVEKDRILMTGQKLVLQDPENTITAKKQIEFWNRDNYGVALGDAVIYHLDRIVKAEKIVAFFKDRPQKQDPDKTQKEIVKVEGYEKVFVSTPDTVGQGDRGEYFADRDVAYLYGNVKVTQKDSHVQGEKGMLNLKTGYAKMDAPSKKRVQALITPKTLKGQNK